MLSDVYRHALAGVAASAAFLVLYFPLSLIVWAALAGAVLVYVALLLIIRRRPPPAERMLAEGVTAADLDAALSAFEDASRRLRALEAPAPRGDRGVFAGMASLLDRIASHHREDPTDLRHTGRFLRHDLPRLVETSERYVALAARALPADSDRLAELSALIRGFAPTLERIDRACLENDFMALEVEAEVLSDQLARR